MAQYLQMLSRDSGAAVILLLDDLHWADDGSLDFINHIASACQDTPILLLCLTRPALFERRPMWCSGRDNQQRVDLAPLSRRNSRDLTEALLAGLGTTPVALRDLVTSSAEGNPYFVEELIGMLIDDGVIVTDGERWHVNADRLLHVRVPSTLAGCVRRGWTRCRTGTGHAAACQRDWPCVLGRGAAADGAGRLGARRPDAADLARGRDTSAFEGTREYVFKHHLLHKVTYDSVLKRDKREKHRLIAEWLVARSGERASEYHGLIADHFEKAGDTANAILYLRKAARDAARAYAVEVALGCFDRALALMPESPERFDVLLRRLDTAFDRRAGEVHERNLIEMEALAEVLNDDSCRALAASFRVTYLACHGDLEATSAAAVKALAYAKSSGNSAAAMRAHNQWGHALSSAGKVAAAREQLEQGLALARSAGNWSGEASALELLGRMASGLGRYGEARRHLEAARELAQRNGDQGWANSVHCTLAENDLSIGHYERANEQLLPC